MTDNFDLEPFINNYIKNIRAMQELTDAQIREVMMRKIEDNPDYFEIISDVSQKVDDKKLIHQVLGDHQKPLNTDHLISLHTEGKSFPPIQDPIKFSGRKIA